MLLRRALATSTALLAATVGTLVSIGPAAADADSANVVVELSAKRHILSASSWSDVEVFVRNDGPVPAANVTVALTLPPGLHPFGGESTSDWNCDWGIPVLTCTAVGDLAPGARLRAIRDSVEPEAVPAGSTLVVGAAATTTSPESSTADNAASGTISIVPEGVIRGTIWNDLNADGIRQANEPNARDVGMSYRSQDDEDGSGVANNFGTYTFSVPSKRYKVVTQLQRYNWRFTKPDAGSEDTDSDLRLISDDGYTQTGESSVFTVDPAAPSVLDLGVVAAMRPTNISPASARQGATTAVTLTGESFSSDLTVQLTRPGSDPIPGVVNSVTADRTSMTVTFSPGQAAPGTWTVTLSRRYGPYAEVADAFTITGAPLRATTAPSITGTLAVGSTVTANPGTWNATPASYLYQWYTEGVPVPGATAATMTIPPALLGKRLVVKVTAQRPGYPSGYAMSAPWAAVKAGAPAATRR